MNNIQTWIQSNPIITGYFLFTLGHVFTWYGNFSQLFSQYWSDKPLLSTLVFGIPGTILFWYAFKYTYTGCQDLWSARFTGFALSYLTFPILTWIHLNQSPFTIKTLVTTLLAFAIMICQIAMP